MNLVIYASELAAVIGLNQYKSVEESTVQVLKRNKPNIYKNALNRNKYNEINVEKIIKELKLTSVVENGIKSINSEE